MGLIILHTSFKIILFNQKKKIVKGIKMRTIHFFPPKLRKILDENMQGSGVKLNPDTESVNLIVWFTIVDVCMFCQRMTPNRFPTEKRV